MFTGDAVDNFLEPNKIIKAKRQSGYVLATRGATKANFDAYGDAMLGAFEAGYGSGWTVAHQEAWGKCLGNLMDMYRLGVEDFQKEERDKKQAAIEEAKAAADKEAIKAAEKEAAEAQKAVEAAEKKRQEEDAKRNKERDEKAKKLASAEAKKSDEELMEERQAKESRMQMVRANQSARMKREAEAL